MPGPLTNHARVGTSLRRRPSVVGRAAAKSRSFGVPSAPHRWCRVVSIQWNCCRLRPNPKPEKTGNFRNPIFPKLTCRLSHFLPCNALSPVPHFLVSLESDPSAKMNKTSTKMNTPGGGGCSKTKVGGASSVETLIALCYPFSPGEKARMRDKLVPRPFAFFRGQVPPPRKNEYKMSTF
jgi:hypothetical protein